MRNRDRRGDRAEEYIIVFEKLCPPHPVMRARLVGPEPVTVPLCRGMGKTSEVAILIVRQVTGHLHKIVKLVEWQPRGSRGPQQTPIGMQRVNKLERWTRFFIDLNTCLAQRRDCRLKARLYPRINWARRPIQPSRDTILPHRRAPRGRQGQLPSYRLVHVRTSQP